MAIIKVKDSGDTVEVKNVFCVGKNYVDHINEMNIPGIANEIPETPVIFLKPSTAIETKGNIVRVPVINGKVISENLQNEVELVIIIGKDGDDMPEENALEYIYGYAAKMISPARPADGNEENRQALGSCQRIQNFITGI